MLIPEFKLLYENKDITKSVAPFVISIEYKDVEHGESDELTIQFEDAEKLWQGDWIPSKVDSLKLHLGYKNQKLLNCGIFEIDETEYDTPPDTVSVKALATEIKKPLRERNSKGYEKTTLKKIAKSIADKHGYKLIADVEDVQIDRITQNKEYDLTFLKNLAEEYGYIFKISDNKLVFYDVLKLKGAKSAVIFNKTDLIQINLREKTSQKYKSVQVKYFNPKTKKTVTASAKNDSVKKGDTLKITTRITNKKQAQTMANAALANSNTKIEGTFETVGNPNLVAGSNVEIKGIGHFSGKYHLKTVRHYLDRTNGYKTYCEVESC